MMKKKVTSDKDMRNFRMRGEKKRDNIKWKKRIWRELSREKRDRKWSCNSSSKKCSETHKD